MKKIVLTLFATAIAPALLTSCALVNVKLTRTHSVAAQRTIQSLAASSEPGALLQKTEDKSLPQSERIELLLEALRETSKARVGTEFQKVNQIATARLVEILATENFQNSAIRITPASINTVNPQKISKLIAAHSIQIKGLRERVTVEGAGVAYVAWFAKGSPSLDGQPSAAQTGISIPVTALVRFDKNGPQLTFYRRLQI